MSHSCIPPRGHCPAQLWGSHGYGEPGGLQLLDGGAWIQPNCAPGLPAVSPFPSPPQPHPHPHNGLGPTRAQHTHICSVSLPVSPESHLRRGRNSGRGITNLFTSFQNIPKAGGRGGLKRGKAGAGGEGAGERGPGRSLTLGPAPQGSDSCPTYPGQTGSCGWGGALNTLPRVPSGVSVQRPGPGHRKLQRTPVPAAQSPRAPGEPPAGLSHWLSMSPPAVPGRAAGTFLTFQAVPTNYATGPRPVG